MDCKRFRSEIEESGAGVGAAAEAHLAACAPCHALRTESRALGELVAALPRVDAPGDFEFRLRARLAATGARRAGWRTYFPRAAWATAAGCLLLALGVSLRQREPIQTATDGGSNTPPVVEVATVNNPAQPARRADDAVAATTTNKAAEVSRPELVSKGGGEGVKGKTFDGRAAVRRGRRQTVVPRAVLEEVAAGPGEAGSLEEHSRSVIGGSVIALPVQAEEQPLQVTFRDMQGASRVVKVDPVAFGSRDPAAAGARVVKASHKQGVW